MHERRINRITARLLIALAFTALLAVLSGWNQPPQPDEGTAAHIFQICIALCLPVFLLFFTTADWRRPQRYLRALAVPAIVIAVAFAVLFHVEHVH